MGATAGARSENSRCRARRYAEVLRRWSRRATAVSSPCRRSRARTENDRRADPAPCSQAPRPGEAVRTRSRLRLDKGCDPGSRIALLARAQRRIDRYLPSVDCSRLSPRRSARDRTRQARQAASPRTARATSVAAGDPRTFRAPSNRPRPEDVRCPAGRPGSRSGVSPQIPPRVRDGRLRPMSSRRTASTALDRRRRLSLLVSRFAKLRVCGGRPGSAGQFGSCCQ